MTTLYKYKRLLAWALLALYVFVATPVQVWHHHDGCAKKPPQTQSDKAKASLQKAAFAQDDCGICSHQYAVYSGGVAMLFAMPLLSVAKPQHTATVAIPLAPHFYQSNKGPPSLA